MAMAPELHQYSRGMDRSSEAVVNAQEWARRAAAFDAELRDHADDTDLTPADLANALHRAGESLRAADILKSIISEGGEEGEYARASLAEIWFDLGRTEEALDVLAELRRVGSDPGPRLMVAELLAERGEHATALRWFNLAAMTVDPAQPNLLDLVVLRGRREVRSHLGLPVDSLDELTAEVETELQTPLYSPADAASAGVATSADLVRVLVVQPQERLGAIAEYGSCFGELPFDAAAANAELESSLRQASEQGPGRVDMVFGTVASMRSFFAAHGGHPTDDHLRARYLDQRHAEGATAPWPPPRNAPCWCGSGRKYKNCCRQ